MSEHHYTPPSAKQVKRHWQSQEPSLFRKPNSRDKGISIVTDKKQMRAIVAHEIAGEAQEVFRLKSPAGEWHDPLARMNDLIRMSTQRGVDAKTFRELCQTPDDLMIYELLYGEMTSSQRSNGLIKVADQMFRKQQEVLKQANIQKQREDAKEARLMKSRAALAKRAQKDSSE